MRKHWLMVGAVVLLTGCAPTIKRYGYDLKSSVPEKPTTGVVIHYKKTYDPNEANFLGRAEVNKGVSMLCDESQALKVLIKEAQGLGADIINITEDEVPNPWTNCYQASAEFLRLKDRGQVVNLKSEPWYEPEFIEQRRKTAAQRGRSPYVAGAMGGLIGGIIAAGH